MNDRTEYGVAAGGQRHYDRTTQAGRGAGGSRPLATRAAAMLAIAALILPPNAISEAQAQRVVSVNGAKRTAAIMVPVGKTEDVRVDAPFSDVTVGDPEVADVTPLTDHALSILGKKIGTTRVTMYGEGKRLVGLFDIEVSYDVSRLSAELARITGGGIRVSSVNGRIMLSGTSHDAATLDKAVVIARQFAPDIINTVQVLQPQQVVLEVRFIEANRQAGRELGFQWNTFGKNTLTNIGSQVPASQLPVTRPGGPFQQPPLMTTDPAGQVGGKNILANQLPISPIVAAGVLGTPAAPFGFLLGTMARGGLSIDVAINALEEKGLARSLAEPNLVALSGDTASFLAGGEYPIPVPGGLGTVTIDYKKYGVGLAFTPTVLRDGLINLKIVPEVSELDYSHPVQFAGILDSAVDRAQRLDDGRAARRPELRDRRPVAEQEHERAAATAMARRRAGARRPVPQRGVSEERDRSRHHRHAASRASDPPGRPGQDAARQHAAGQRRRLLPDGQGGDHARRGSARGRSPAAVRRSHSRYSKGGRQCRRCQELSVAIRRWRRSSLSAPCSAAAPTSTTTAARPWRSAPTIISPPIGSPRWSTRGRVYVGDKNIAFNGQRMQAAVERYRHNRVIPPVNATTTSMTQQQATQQAASANTATTQTTTQGAPAAPVR